MINLSISRHLPFKSFNLETFIFTDIGFMSVKHSG
uniref:Uncharacterized protein n=1 Tax=Tetranychus urticae TaxID=32264 RepID=T1KX30_TETUR